MILEFDPGVGAAPGCLAAQGIARYAIAPSLGSGPGDEDDDERPIGDPDEDDEGADEYDDADDDDDVLQCGVIAAASGITGDDEGRLRCN